MDRDFSVLQAIRQWEPSDREDLLLELQWPLLRLDQALESLVRDGLISGAFLPWTVDKSRRFTIAMGIRLTPEGRACLDQAESALHHPVFRPGFPSRFKLGGLWAPRTTH